jgi:hypothetical protein
VVAEPFETYVLKSDAQVIWLATYQKVIQVAMIQLFEGKTQNDSSYSVKPVNILALLHTDGTEVKHDG